MPLTLRSFPSGIGWRNLRFRVQAKLHFALKASRPLIGRLDYDRREILLYVSSPTEYHTRLHSCAKEPETVAWIEQSIRPGDVFYDIGANVGAYTLVAARFWGTQVRTVAIEPNPLNFARLIQNLQLNRCTESVIPLPVALADSTGIFPFHVQNLEAGGALHALGEALDHRGSPFTPAATHPMITCDLDALIELFRLPAPTHLKLDVDGIELGVLRGARRALREVRSLLLEVDEHRPDGPAIRELLEESGLRLSGNHPYRYAHVHRQFDGISNLLFERDAIHAHSA